MKILYYMNREINVINNNNQIHSKIKSVISYKSVKIRLEVLRPTDLKTALQYSRRKSMYGSN